MTEAQTQSPPPIQIMDKTDGFDPYRIPSSVFESAKSQNLEWSMASNESLFSIHPGNSSFSRDQILLMDKSGELETLWSSSPELMEDSRVLAAGLEEGGTPPAAFNEDCGDSRTAGNVIGDHKLGQESLPVIATSSSCPASAPQSPAENRPSCGSVSTPSSTKSFAFPIYKRDRDDREYRVDILPPLLRRRNNPILTAVDHPEKSGSVKLPPDAEEPPREPAPPPPQQLMTGWFSCMCSRPRCC